MATREEVQSAALRRIESVRSQIAKSIEYVRLGNPLAAETEPDRLVRRIQSKARVSPTGAAMIARGIRAGAVTRGESGAERIYGSSADFVGVVFLERGVDAARAVARVAYPGGQPHGTGFLVSSRLLLTNNHVIATRSEAKGLVVEFDYELDGFGRPRDASRFELDPGTFFLTNDTDDLDFTLVAIGRRIAGKRSIEEFSCCSLSGANDKHALGEVANIVQHPDGRYKEVVLRENRLVSRLDTVLHYVADTEPGSSGSPVFNNEWQVIALHHWGGPWRQTMDVAGQPVPPEVNEGIRISAIVGDLRRKAPDLSSTRRRRIESLLSSGESGDPVKRPSTSTESSHEFPSARLEDDGRVVWRIPLEVSVRLPFGDGGLPDQPQPAPTVIGPVSTDDDDDLDEDDGTAERAIKVDRNYDNRSGYKPRFIKGHRVDLPTLPPALQTAAARNKDADAGDDPFELRYEHFSVVVNKKRRLAFFTACNIDGKNLKAINRKTGEIKPAKVGSGESMGGAEASETWFGDDRLEGDEQTNQELYAKQRVDGFDTGSKGWMDRMMQRGHLVRRADPTWGSKKERVYRAEADTFHFVNCTPQVGFFNMGSAPSSTPKSGGGRLWRAIEDYVLDNAIVEDARVSVFTGPVLAKDDPLWRKDVIPGFRVPLKFWKIVVWSAGGSLKALAMVADQGPVLKRLPEGAPTAEDFDDTSAVEDFQSTVAEVEALTGLVFSDAVRRADVRAGGESASGRSKSRRAAAPQPIKRFDELRGIALRRR